jgi:hypothetical protein
VHALVASRSAHNRCACYRSSCDWALEVQTFFSIRQRARTKRKPPAYLLLKRRVDAQIWVDITTAATVESALWLGYMWCRKRQDSSQ